MSIFEALTDDHQKQRTLIDLLVKTHGDSDGRDELFVRLKAELEHHALAEERHFYTPLMEADLTQEKARHSIAEHQEIDELLDELTQTDYSSPGWVATATRLRERLLHHLDEEEQEVFQLAGKHLSDDRKQSLATEYRAHMETLRASG